MKKARCISVLGTASDVGKSIVVTALCRYFARHNIRVAPFKSQNMSNNSGVTPEGLEMGRAQLVQSEAAGISPEVDMNPVLLKPTSDIGSQVVLLGKALDNYSAKRYLTEKETLFSVAADALDRLRSRFDLIIMEGAGSCAEVNLMDYDIVNLRMADYAEAPVLLVADIHRGGVFAQIVGTLACLHPNQQAQIKGFIINRFRGDIQLFEDGVDWIERQTQKRVFGVLPWYHHIQIEPEDSVVIENPRTAYPTSGNHPSVAVIRLPHISNFTDFNPIQALKNLDLYFVEKVQDLSPFKAVIIPGSKNTRFDLGWIISSGWLGRLNGFVADGGHLLGICGGYQMMGKSVHDPTGLEGRPGSSQGLDLLPIETTLKAPKTTTLTQFYWESRKGAGYEIHMGHTVRKGGSPLFAITERNQQACRDEDGCVSMDKKIMGTYIHGLFDNPEILKYWLEHIGLSNLDVPDVGGIEARGRQYDLLAENFEQYVDVESIMRLAT
jgi:adenosylcobyric acid synthase